MYPDAVTVVLRSLESRRSTVFGVQDLQRWPAETIDALLEAGLFGQPDYARSVVCRECPNACGVEVYFIEGRDGEPPSAFIECTDRDDIGRVSVALDELRTYTPSPSGLAKWLASQLGAVSAVESAIDSRLWWLGEPTINDRRADVFLAIGVSWPDAPTVFSLSSDIKQAREPVVIVPHEIPDPHPFRFGARLLPLSRLVSIEDGILKLDRCQIAPGLGQARVGSHDTFAPFERPPGVTWGGIAMILLTDSVIEIRAGSKCEKRSYDQMGLQDRRTSSEVPSDLWRALVALAEAEGEFDWNDAKKLDKPITLEKKFSLLRIHLKRFFGLDDDPFEPYRKYKAYKTKFTLIDRR